jgi:hypothetical protein
LAADVDVWSQVRTDASLRTQAEFINRLKEGDIWTNVIIIVKQSINPRYTPPGYSSWRITKIGNNMFFSHLHS